jgi:hypothetical protein
MVLPALELVDDGIDGADDPHVLGEVRYVQGGSPWGSPSAQAV